MPKNSTEWTKSYCGVTHFLRDGIQYTVSDRGRFADLEVYSWEMNQLLVSRCKKFFRCELGEDCFDEVSRFWNCPDPVGHAKDYALSHPGRQAWLESHRQNTCRLPTLTQPM
ncbi:MAG: hypothetical protein KME35_23915 [Aphanocapsa sp. GSE-SYN-MK-11-07L]|nr:hypothetical protein [Aphanocapsa sp. GSE-SYN-MK-11-07L]